MTSYNPHVSDAAWSNQSVLLCETDSLALSCIPQIQTSALHTGYVCVCLNCICFCVIFRLSIMHLFPTIRHILFSTTTNTNTTTTYIVRFAFFTFSFLFLFLSIHSRTCVLACLVLSCLVWYCTNKQPRSSEPNRGRRVLRFASSWYLLVAVV